MKMVAGQLQPNTIPAVPNKANVSAWLFDPKVDIDNDGQPDNVAIWRNWPPRWDDDALTACGVEAPSAYQPETVDQVPFIFTTNYPGIDIPKSVAVFGDTTPLPKG
jgi:hypothetical protein